MLIDDSRLCNLRDVGGIPLVGGGSVATGVLYRGEAPVVGDLPPRITPWPPATVIDLRSDDERAALLPTEPWPDGVKLVETSLFADLNPLTVMTKDNQASLTDFVTAMLTEAVRSRPATLVEIVSLVAIAPPPILVHCTGGKDRTSLVIALVLDAVGADTEAVVADHMRTGDVVTVLEARMARALGKPLERSFPPPEVAPLRAALELLRSHRGGSGGWLVDNGLPPEALTALLRKLRRR